jgi:hypothetical protein
MQCKRLSSEHNVAVTLSREGHGSQTTETAAKTAGQNVPLLAASA